MTVYIFNILSNIKLEDVSTRLDYQLSVAII